MHCDICDREDDLISYEKLTQTFSPCTTCQAVIDDCIAGYEPVSTADPKYEYAERCASWDTYDEMLGYAV